MICARSEVGLSRLPVTEEIAGSNPVERATDNSPLDRVFFYGKYSIFIAFMCNLCYDIANWTEKSKEFYNKIPDNVRERTPSVMVKNHENFSPSGSETQLPTLLKEKALKGIATAAALLAAVAPLSACGETHNEPTPDTTTSTAQETQNPTPSPKPSPEVSASSCIKFDGDQELIEDLKSAKTDGEKRNAFVEFARKQTDKPMAETNSMGTTTTSTVNLVDTVEQLGRDSATTLEAAINLAADGCISNNDKKFMADAFVSSSTLGQASKSLGRAFDFAIRYPEDNESEKDEVSCKEVLYTTKAKDIEGVKQPPHVMRDYSENDPLKGTDLKGGIFASQTVCETNDGQTLIEQITLVKTSSNQNSIDNLSAGEQAEIMVNPYIGSDDMAKNAPRYASWTILTHRGVNPDTSSEIPALYEGEKMTIGKVPAIKEALAKIEEARTNK